MPNTREKLIELLNEASEILLETAGGFNDNHGNGMRADHLIANGVTVQEWIPVTERLPGVTGTYIVANKAGVFPGEYVLEMNKWFGGFGEVRTPVTHWMPLPEPPKEEINHGES